MIDITDVSLYKMPRSISEMESSHELLETTNINLINENLQLKESNERLKVALLFSCMFCFISVLGNHRQNSTELGKHLMKDLKKRA